MKNSLFPLLVLIFVLLAFSLLFAEDANSVLNESELREMYEENLVFKQQIYDWIKDFISDNPDFKKIDELYFRLAELSTDLYIGEPEYPLNYYKKVFELSPNFAVSRDAILYNIAFYSTEKAKQDRDAKRQNFITKMVQQERVEPIIQWPIDMVLSEAALNEAIAAYRELLLNYPSSQYFSESLYRLAVVYYDIGLDAEQPIVYYQKAKELFNVLAEQEGDEFQHLGLYQRAWSFFSTNRYEDAIKDFAAILNVIAEETQYKAYFEQDAIDNIAFSLESIDGQDYLSESQSVVYAKNNLPVFIEDKEYQQRVLKRAVDIKLELNAPLHAISYYNALVELFPLNIANPSLVDSISTLYSRYGYIQANEQEVRNLVTSQQERIINSYNSESEWYSSNKNNPDLSDQFVVIRNSFEYIEPIYWNRFVRESNLEDYQNYYNIVSLYSNYPDFDNEDDNEWVKEKEVNLVRANLSLADINKTPEHYHNAWKYISYFNSKYPIHEEFIEYELDRHYLISSYYNSMLSDETAIADTTDTLKEVKELYLSELDHFIAIFNNPDFDNSEYTDDLISSLYNRSKIYLDKEQIGDAREDLLEILKYEPEDMLKRDIYIELAKISELAKEHSLAENYYRSASEFALDDQDRNNIRNAYLNQILSQANTHASGESFIDSAEEFLRLSDEFKETNIDRSIGYKQQAIEKFIAAEAYKRSIDLLIELSELRNEPAQVNFLYKSAWDIADTLMMDTELVDQLKNEFITKYPESYEAFYTRYEIIIELSEQEDTKYQAAEMLLELHNDAKYGTIDIGTYKTSDIYFDALQLFYDHQDEMLVIDLMLEFEKLYPDDPRANDLLVEVAVKYDNNEMSKEFEELSRYIYRKDPNIKFYENIARTKLGKIYNDVVALYTEQKFQDMMQRIADFRALDQKFQQDNLTLNLEDAYLDFQDFQFVYEQEKKFQSFLTRMSTLLDTVESEYTEAAAGTLFRVNNLTKWQTNIIEGNKRLEGAVNQAYQQHDKIAKILAEANEIELETNSVVPLEYRTRAIYLIGKVYDHTADIISTQLDRYLQISDEMRGLKDYDVNEFNAFADYVNNNFKVPYINHLVAEAVPWYNAVYTNFAVNLEHNDEFTELAKNRLSELGLLTEQISLYSNLDWKAVRSSSKPDITQSANFKSVFKGNLGETQNNLVGFEGSEAIPIYLTFTPSETGEDSPNEVYYMKTFSVDGEVVDAVLRFFSTASSSVWINDVEIITDASPFIDEADNTAYAQTLELPTRNFVQGENTIMIKSNSNFVRVDDSDPAVLFDLNLVISK